MITCPKCSIESPDGQKFCRSCGNGLQAVAAAEPVAPPAPTTTGPTCGACGQVAPVGQRFCRGCGGALSEEAAAHQPSRVVPLVDLRKDEAPTDARPRAYAGGGPCSICGAPAGPGSTVCGECASTTTQVLPTSETYGQPRPRADDPVRPTPPPPGGPGAVPVSGGSSRRGRTIAVVATVVLLLGGAGAGAAVLLSGDDDKAPAGVAAADPSSTGSITSDTSPTVTTPTTEATPTATTPTTTSPTVTTTEPGVTVQTTEPDPTVTPAPPTSVKTPGSVISMRRHWENRDSSTASYGDAYEVYAADSPKSVGARATWIQQRETESPSVVVREIRLQKRVSSDEHWVYVDVLLRDAGGEPCRHFSGRAVMVKRGGRWRWRWGDNAQTWRNADGTGAESTDPDCP